MLQAPSLTHAFLDTNWKARACVNEAGKLEFQRVDDLIPQKIGDRDPKVIRSPAISEAVLNLNGLSKTRPRSEEIRYPARDTWTLLRRDDFTESFLAIPAETTCQ